MAGRQKVAARQDPLIAHYRTEPQAAQITDRARTLFDADRDPFHGSVTLGQPEVARELEFGIHPAVGGYGDKPNPGDLLCGALAACLDSTIRIIAERMSVEIVRLEVEVEGLVDVRGTLRVDPSVPVGFEQLLTKVELRLGEGTTREMQQKLIAAAEHSCVNLQTLIGGGAVELGVDR